MAKQKGPIKYAGTIGDIRHFKIKGLTGYYAGLTGGPTASQIKNAPEFARTRENMNEFGGSAKTAKSLRNGLARVLFGIADPYVTGRLTAVMKRINLEDNTGTRGFRSILVSNHKDYLKGFEFNKNIPFKTIFSVPMDYSKNLDGDYELVIQPFSAQSEVLSPSGATHFRIIWAVAVLSDFEYNPNTKSYEPTVPETNELNGISYSEYLPVIGEVSETEVYTTIDFSGLTEPSNLIACVGIEFYQKVNTNYSRLKANSGLYIYDVASFLG